MEEKPLFCDFDCPNADFPKDSGIDGAGSCMTFSAVWCRALKAYVAKHGPCRVDDVK